MLAATVGTGGGGDGGRSHAKSFSIDRTLFYIGSQNFYHTGIGTEGEIDLAEHGFLIDGYGVSKHLADSYHADYAIPTWNAGLGGGVYVRSGCDDVAYPTRLQGSASTGNSCDITFDTSFDFDSFDLDKLASFYGEGTCMTGGYTIDITISGDIPITGDPATHGVIQNGVITGAIVGTNISDSTSLTGTFKVDGTYSNELDAIFSDLELGVSYSGTVTRE